MNHSIRKHLLTYLIIALLISSAVIATITYMVASEELDELYDKNMKQLTEALIKQHNDYEFINSKANKLQKKLHGEEEFLIQVWDSQGKIIYTSHPPIKYPRQDALGYGFSDFENEIWRYYSAKEKNFTIQLSQVMDSRQEAIVEISGEFLIPLLLQIPLLGLLIWFVVGRGLKPLNDISQAINTRNPQAMHALPLHNLPVEIKPLVLALNELLARLDDAIKVQRRFTADAAHELRTPLTAVQLQLDLLKLSKSDKDKKESLGKLTEGIKRSIHVVRQLLALAHQEPESTEKTTEQFNLYTVVEGCISQLEQSAKQKNISLKLVSKRSNYKIYGNAASLCVMVENLIDNSIRYTQKNGKIEVSLIKTKTHIKFKVSDNGRGIPEEERSRVFDRFYRVVGTEESGSGLGLSIVKRIADQHKARIKLEDGLNGRGIAISVIFPI